MRYAVLRPFSTPARRFAIGDVVWVEEMDGPVSVLDRVATGFMKPDDPEKPIKPLAMRRNQVLPPPVVKDNEDAV